MSGKAKPIHRELWDFDWMLFDLIQRKLRRVPPQEIEEQYGSECLVDFVARVLDP